MKRPSNIPEEFSDMRPGLLITPLGIDPEEVPRGWSSDADLAAALASLREVA